MIAPYALRRKNSAMSSRPPQSVHLFHDGEFVGPFVYGVKRSSDPETLQRDLHENPKKGAAAPVLLSGENILFGASFEATSTSSVRRKRAVVLCSEPTGWAGTCFRALFTARVFP